MIPHAMRIFSPLSGIDVSSSIILQILSEPRNVINGKNKYESVQYSS